jgi:hypothetical protein
MAALVSPQVLPGLWWADSKRRGGNSARLGDYKRIGDLAPREVIIELLSRNAGTMFDSAPELPWRCADDLAHLEPANDLADG